MATNKKEELNEEARKAFDTALELYRQWKEHCTYSWTGALESNDKANPYYTSFLKYLAIAKSDKHPFVIKLFENNKINTKNPEQVQELDRILRERTPRSLPSYLFHPIHPTKAKKDNSISQDGTELKKHKKR